MFIEILIDTECTWKMIGGLEVQNELILTEVGPLATMDPIQRGSVTIPLPQETDRSRYIQPSSGIHGCTIVWGSLGLSMPMGPPIYFGTNWRDFVKQEFVYFRKFPLRSSLTPPPQKGFTSYSHTSLRTSSVIWRSPGIEAAKPGV